MSDHTLYPPTGPVRRWPDTPADLPVTHTARTFNNLAPLRVQITAPLRHEYLRYLATPELYEPWQVDDMREDYLTQTGQTEWPCGTCGALNYTPDAEFNGSTPCAHCPPPEPCCPGFARGRCKVGCTSWDAA